MAPELKSKKRKAAVPEDEIAKVEKVQKMTAEILPKKRKASDDVISTLSKKSKAIAHDGTLKSALKKSKSSESQSDLVKEVLASKPKSSQDVLKAKKKLKKAAAIQKAEEAPKETLVEEATANEGDSDAYEELDDQTEALLKGFESDDDEDINADAEDRNGQPIPALDKKTKKKMKKLQEKLAEQAKSDGPGVVYLGRIPHGFYENEMRQYFSQFGEIKNIRLSRNPKTGASKHYAFIEFDSYDVAEIVAKTMDNYLMFGHIMKCKLIAKDQVHDKLFIGANRRFKKVPWNKIAGRKLDMASGETKWEKKIEAEKANREKKSKALLEMMDYSYDAPVLKSAKSVSRQSKTSLILEAEPEELDGHIKTIEAPGAIVNTVTSTVFGEGGKKKYKKSKTTVNGTTVREATTIELPQGITAEAAFSAPIEAKTKKGKKGKKSATVAVEEPVVADVDVVVESVVTEKTEPMSEAKKTKNKKSKAKTADAIA